MITYNYQTFGKRENQPLLFLHGFIGSSSDWDTICNTLKNSYYCISIDLPGHGATTVTDDNDYTMENTANAVIELLDKLNITTANLCGYSMGGRLAFYLAVHHSDRFDKIVIESSSPGLKTEQERKDRRTKDSLIINRLQMQPFESFLNDWYEIPLFKTLDKQSDKFKSLFQKRLNNDPNKLALSLKYCGTGSQPPFWDDLDKIKADLLLITGSLDKKYNITAEEIILKQPKFQRAVIDGAGHNVHLELETEYINVIKEFLDKK